MYNQAGTVSYIYYFEKGTGQGLPPPTPPRLKGGFNLCLLALCLPSYKAGKGESRCPGVYPQRAFSTGILNEYPQGGITKCLCIVTPQQEDTIRILIVMTQWVGTSYTCVGGPVLGRPVTAPQGAPKQMVDLEIYSYYLY